MLNLRFQSKTVILLLTCNVLLGLLTPDFVLAQSPSLINFQASVDGLASDNADIEFVIFDENESELWREAYDQFPIPNGKIIRVLLGSKETIGENVFLENGERYLGVFVNGEELLPRSRITSVGYALRAKYSDQIPDDAAVKSLNELTGSVNLVEGNNIDIVESEGNLIISSIAQSGNEGDITGVIAGEGLTGGASSGEATLSLADDGVTDEKMAPGAVSTETIKDGAVTSNKIAAGVISNERNTLDEAYDEGGQGLGRTIVTDSGPIDITGSGGLLVQGKVGIGTTSPLQFPNILVHIEDSDMAFRDPANAVNDRILYFQRTVTGLNGSSRGYKFSWRNDNGTARINAFEMDRNGQVYFSGGNVGIGTINPTSKLHVVGNIFATGSITPGSSRALKEQINNLSIDEAQEALNELNPVKYFYKAEKEKDLHLGFIAEDVPDLLSTIDRKGVDPMDIIAILTKVSQEQQVMIQQLQAEINELKERIN